MNTHVLNGDALATGFPFEGNIIVCRECLIEGPVNTKSFDAFWNNRAKFITQNFEADGLKYQQDVRNEFEKLKTLSGSTIHLWFEHDLFCQVNMWFTLYFLQQNNISQDIFVVMPPSEGNNIWLGYGKMSDADLESCFRKKVKFSESDLKLANDLWLAFQFGDLEKLKSLSHQNSPCFPLLEEVCEAHIDRFSKDGFGRPERKLRAIVDNGINDFPSVFREFWKTEGIYGFGDTQVKKLLEKIS